MDTGWVFLKDSMCGLSIADTSSPLSPPFSISPSLWLFGGSQLICILIIFTEGRKTQETSAGAEEGIVLSLGVALPPRGAVGSFQDFCEKAAGGVSSQRDPALPRTDPKEPTIRCSESLPSPGPLLSLRASVITAILAVCPLKRFSRKCNP